MPDKFKKSFEKKLDRTAEKIKKHAKNPKPSLKVKGLLKMFASLHLKGKLWEIDNEYWQKHLH